MKPLKEKELVVAEHRSSVRRKSCRINAPRQKSTPADRPDRTRGAFCRKELMQVQEIVEGRVIEQIVEAMSYDIEGTSRCSIKRAPKVIVVLKLTVRVYDRDGHRIIHNILNVFG